MFFFCKYLIFNLKGNTNKCFPYFIICQLPHLHEHCFLLNCRWHMEYGCWTSLSWSLTDPRWSLAGSCKLVEYQSNHYQLVMPVYCGFRCILVGDPTNYLLAPANNLLLYYIIFFRKHRSLSTLLILTSTQKRFELQNLLQIICKSIRRNL